MSENVHHNNSSGKCLCPYCSGTIAKELTAMNEQNVLECNQLVEKYVQGGKEDVLNELSTKLDYLNPVQCFDIFDQLCSNYPSTTANRELDQLILKFVVRFRNNGGFFIALKEPSNRRQYLLTRLTDTILVNHDNAQKANLTVAEIQ